jgi:SAM-dependent methyltransferase
MDSATWDQRYGGADFVWKTTPNQFLVVEVADAAPGRALDLACGEGRNAVWLAERGWHVTGVDFSPVGLAKADRLANERDVEVQWVEADVVEWEPPAAAFDLVIVFYLHLPATERRRVLAHAQDALAAGGTLLVVGHDTSNLMHGYGGPQDPTVLFTPDEIALDLDRLRITRADHAERRVDTSEGAKVAIDTLVRAVRSSS